MARLKPGAGGVDTETGTPADAAALQAWLQRQGIDTTGWGRQGAKGVPDLWSELARGECRLQADPPRRLVTIVQILIRRRGRLLLELAQEFGDGRLRRRLIPPSEKMRPGEDVAAAAGRGLREELGVAADQVTLHPETRRQKTRRAMSPSYPGLPTHYVIYQIGADVAGLPATDFWRPNGSYGPEDPVRRQQWGWRLQEEP